MKQISILMLCLVAFSASAQNEFDGANWKAPYTLNFPEGWGVERFLIPIEFAPQIHYKGVEDLRFAPGWPNEKSDEYWTYAFLWYLDEVPVTNEAGIQANLNAYYTGLIGRNIEKRKIPSEKIFPVKTSMKEVSAAQGDLKTFHGTIAMLDYMAQKPITLNCVVHLKSCPGQPKGFMFYEISPKPMTDKVWTSLGLLWKTFDCKPATTK
jgi:hypothetical protein